MYRILNPTIYLKSFPAQLYATTFLSSLIKFFCSSSCNNIAAAQKEKGTRIFIQIFIQKIFGIRWDLLNVMPFLRGKN